MSDKLPRKPDEEFKADFIAEIREVFQKGKTVGEIAYDYEMEPELVRDLLGADQHNDNLPIGR